MLVGRDVIDSMAVLFILQRIHYQQQTKKMSTWLRIQAFRASLRVLASINKKPLDD